jgi:hypothetical protein
MCRDQDAAWLFAALAASPLRRATHLMHLEENRFALYCEAACFLEEDDSSDRRSR